MVDLTVALKKDAVKDTSNEIVRSIDGVISFQTEVPESLQAAMTSYIEKHPNWDQYRIFQAALAGFLVQNGITSRKITRLYVGNMFGGQFGKYSSI